MLLITEVGCRPLLTGLARNLKYMHKQPTYGELPVPCIFYSLEPGEFVRKGTSLLFQNFVPKDATNIAKIFENNKEGNIFSDIPFRIS